MSEYFDYEYPCTKLLWALDEWHDVKQLT